MYLSNAGSKPSGYDPAHDDWADYEGIPDDVCPDCDYVKDHCRCEVDI